MYCPAVRRVRSSCCRRSLTAGQDRPGRHGIGKEFEHREPCAHWELPILGPGSGNGARHGRLSALNDGERLWTSAASDGRVTSALRRGHVQRIRQDTRVCVPRASLYEALRFLHKSVDSIFVSTHVRRLSPLSRRDGPVRHGPISPVPIRVHVACDCRAPMLKRTGPHNSLRHRLVEAPTGWSGRSLTCLHPL